MVGLGDNFSIQIEDGSEVLDSDILETHKKSIMLHNWQNEAIEFFFKNNYKAIYECATGSGKTQLGIELIKHILKIKPDARILIVVPKNIIMESGWYKELYDNGIGLDKIGVFYGKIKEYGQITITNMQNMEKIATDIFDAYCFDEIHNYSTVRLMKIFKQKKFMIGLSATLERHDNKHLKMCKLFNFNIFRYTPKDALNDGILNAFKFVNMAVECDEEFLDRYTILTTEINHMMQLYKILKKDSGMKIKILQKLGERKKMVNNYERKFDAIKIICEKHKDDTIIIFNEYNEITNRLYWYLLDVGIKACCFHSNMKQEIRDQNMMDFKKGKYNVMLATKVLDEGINIPKIQIGIIMAGNSTKKQTIQRCGRILRKKNSESILYQIYCYGTIEAQYAIQRSKLFRELCSDYNEKFLKLNGELI